MSKERANKLHLSFIVVAKRILMTNHGEGDSATFTADLHMTQNTTEAQPPA
jgi:hypothetical protein